MAIPWLINGGVILTTEPKWDDPPSKILIANRANRLSIPFSVFFGGDENYYSVTWKSTNNEPPLIAVRCLKRWYKFLCFPGTVGGGILCTTWDV